MVRRVHWLVIIPLKALVYFRDEYADTRNAKLEKLINRFQAEGPFHGLGLFEVTSSTLMALISTVLTYVVIMVQFQPKKPYCKQLMVKRRDKWGQKNSTT